MTRNISIEIDYGNNEVYISEDNASGSSYKGALPQQVAQAITTYLENNPPQEEMFEDGSYSRFYFELEPEYYAELDKLAKTPKEQLGAKYDEAVSLDEDSDFLDGLNIIAACKFLNIPRTSVRALAYSDDFDYFTIYYDNTSHSFYDKNILIHGIKDEETDTIIRYPEDYQPEE